MVEYVVDEAGNRRAVILSIEEYDQLIEAAQDAEDAREHERVMADVRSGAEPRTMRRSREES